MNTAPTINYLDYQPYGGARDLFGHRQTEVVVCGPARSAPPVSLTLPTRETVAGLDETVTRLLHAVVRGQLTPAEAKGIAAIVEGKRRIQKRVISSHGFRN